MNLDISLADLQRLQKLNEQLNNEDIYTLLALRGLHHSLDLHADNLHDVQIMKSDGPPTIESIIGVATDNVTVVFPEMCSQYIDEQSERESDQKADERPSAYLIRQLLTGLVEKFPYLAEIKYQPR